MHSLGTFIYMSEYTFRHIQIDVQIITENASEISGRPINYQYMHRHWGEIQPSGSRNDLGVNKFLPQGPELIWDVPPFEIPSFFQ